MIGLRLLALMAAFAVAAIAFMPLRLAWAAADTGADVQVDAIRGTIWSGELSGVTWRGVAFGDLAVTSSALDRPGDLVIRARSDAGPLSSAAILMSSRGSIVEEIAASVELAALLPGVPAGLRLRLEEGSITLAGDRCTSAAGRITTDASPTQAIPAFAGQLECREGKLSASVSSSDGVHQLTAQVGLGANASPTVTGASAATQLWLSAMGIPVSAAESDQ